LVPTVVFPNGDIVFDSPEIGKYLDEKYPENPLDQKNLELDSLIKAYTATNMNGFKMSITDIYNQLEGNDHKYYKRGMEKLFGTEFRNIPGDREVNLYSYYKGTQAINKVLENSKFIDGEVPRIHDYTLASRIQCFRTISPNTYKEIILNSPNSNFKRWVGDMDKIFGEYLAQRKTL
jgi:glutathione S-transferase